ncbi:MAG: transcription termination/antitermination factor NusG [Planctomycetes bacterium]|nr:transcription termination/antitermination factor NusG [Planctomycetota bacterium]
MAAETLAAETLAAELPAVEAAAAEVAADGTSDEEVAKQWYILKVQVNREESIRRALLRRVKVAGLEACFGDVVVPTEEIAEFNKSGKRRVVKRKLYPGYIMIELALNDDTWFLVRETPGIGDFTGSAGKPTPMAAHEVQRIIKVGRGVESGESHVKTAIPFKVGERVRVKEGYFENFEGLVDAIDEANGRVTVMINIFGRSTPVELEHWQIETV